MNKDKIDKVVSEMEMLKFFKADRLPKSFYELNDEEKAEAIKTYRRRNGLDKHRPYEETK